LRGRCLSGAESTLVLALVGVGGADDGSLPVYDHDALHVLVRLHTVQRLLDLRHVLPVILSASPGELIGREEGKGYFFKSRRGLRVSSKHCW
jgi:hypothetical protein